MHAWQVGVLQFSNIAAQAPSTGWKLFRFKNDYLCHSQACTPSPNIPKGYNLHSNFKKTRHLKSLGIPTSSVCSGNQAASPGCDTQNRSSVPHEKQPTPGGTNAQQFRPLSSRPLHIFQSKSRAPSIRVYSKRFGNTALFVIRETTYAKSPSVSLGTRPAS